MSDDENAAIDAFRGQSRNNADALPAIFKKPLLSSKSVGASIDPTLPTKVVGKERRRPSNLTNEDLKETFQRIASLYGGEGNARKIVEAEPKVLGYDSTRFSETKAAFVTAMCEGEEAKYSEDDVVAMIMRNPNLIAVRPSGYGGADEADDSTVYMSYVIEATRPLGSILLGTLFLLLLSPAIKLLLGSFII